MLRPKKSPREGAQDEVHAEDLGQDGEAQGGDEQEAELELVRLEPVQLRTQPRQRVAAGREDDAEEHEHLHDQEAEAHDPREGAGLEHGGEDPQQQQTQDVVDQGRGDHGLAQPRLHHPQVDQDLDGDRHRGDRQAGAQEQGLRHAQIRLRKERPPQAESQAQGQEHARHGDEDRLLGGLRHLLRPQVQPREQHQEEHGELGDAVEDLVVPQAREHREGIGEGRDDQAERDARDELPHQDGLAQAFGELAEDTRHDEQDEERVEQFHRTISGCGERPPRADGGEP